MAARNAILAFLLLSFSQSFSQTKIVDSLKKEIAAAKDPQEKIDEIFALCEQRQSFHTDTLAHYADLARKLALEIGDKSNIILADYFVSNYLTKKEQFDTALKITDHDLRELSYKQNKNVYLKFSIQKGQIYLKSERYKEALQQFYKVLNEAEQEGDR